MENNALFDYIQVKIKKTSCDFAKWLADNKWHKQIKYDAWECYGVKYKGSIKSTSELFDIFSDQYNG